MAGRTSDAGAGPSGERETIMALPEQYLDTALLDKDWHTEEEYFAREDRSPGRWEFLPDGAENPGAPRLDESHIVWVHEYIV